MAHRATWVGVTAPVDIAERVDSAGWAGARPRLSILIPFYRDDPTRLLDLLTLETGSAGEVEIVTLDDGGDDADLFAAVTCSVRRSPLPARALRLAANLGRARGRNALAAEARGRHLLFIDSDMLPGRPDFVARWLDVVRRDDPPAAVGGFSPPSTVAEPTHRLHAAIQARSECAPAATRRLAPEKHVFTSNLLVRRDVFEAEAFDPRYTGWGWEDVEWGIRVAARFGVAHIDNPAIHTGLDDAATLLEKYRQSQPNYRRILDRHRDTVRRYPGYKFARLARILPFRETLRRMLRAAVLREAAPLSLRIVALRAYRAALYAEVVG